VDSRDKGLIYPTSLDKQILFKIKWHFLKETGIKQRLLKLRTQWQGVRNVVGDWWQSGDLPGYSRPCQEDGQMYSSGGFAKGQGRTFKEKSTLTGHEGVPPREKCRSCIMWNFPPTVYI